MKIIRTFMLHALALCALLAPSLHAKKPRVVVVFVVDQYAYHYINKLRPHFKHGLQFLLDNGTVYHNAIHPHGHPATATGHAALSTGAFAKDHGITRNKWLDADGNTLFCDDDTSGNAHVFGAAQDKPGKSAHNLMVDTLSDQVVLASQPCAQNHAIAISLKSRAAINLAGKLGKAIWYDSNTGSFTSSKAYFKKLPHWVDTFNTKYLANYKHKKWTTLYPRASTAYCFYDMTNYAFAEMKGGLIDQAQEHAHTSSCDDHEYADIFVKTPHADMATFSLARGCVTEYVRKKNTDTLLLWVGLSALDYCGHAFGPDSLEVTDLIYRLDLNIKKFMNFVRKKTHNDNIVFALTADHGVEPISELMAQRGYPARRLRMDTMIKELNRSMREQFGIDKLIHDFKNPYLFLNHTEFDALSTDKQHEIETALKKELDDQPGIQRVWTYPELQAACFKKDQPEYWYQQQLYPGRSGHIIFQPEPFNVPTTYPSGTTHHTPYEPNTHVPIVLYQKNKIGKKQVNDTVWTLQFAPTIAHLMNIPRPSASTPELLPGVIN